MKSWADPKQPFVFVGYLLVRTDDGSPVRTHPLNQAATQVPAESEDATTVILRSEKTDGR